jgi:hypothetical protein
MKLKWERPRIERWLELYPGRIVGPVVKPPLSVKLSSCEEKPQGVIEFYGKSRPPFDRFVIEMDEFADADGRLSCPAFNLIEYDAATETVGVDCWIEYPELYYRQLLPGLTLCYLDGVTTNLDVLRQRAIAMKMNEPLRVAIEEHAQGQLKLVLELCSIMACSNVYLNEVPVPKFRTMKRAKKALPNVSYWILGVEEHLSLERVDRGGTHASPRQHIRRGHIRVLHRGTERERGVWVQQALISAGSFGRVEKQYQVIL